MTPLERAIRAGCEILNGSCNLPNCSDADCWERMAFKAAIAAALADDEAAIEAMCRAWAEAAGWDWLSIQYKSEKQTQMRAALAALRRRVLEAP